MTIDIAYVFYWIAFGLAVYNGACFAVWGVVSKAFIDERLKIPAYNVLALIGCFAYVLSLNVYARSLRSSNHDAYTQFLNTDAWALRYLPIIVLLSLSSFRLTCWMLHSLKIYYLKKQSGEKWTDRKVNKNGRN
jgi:hypothetical protein